MQLWRKNKAGCRKYATTEIVDGLAKFMEQQKVEDINQLIGIVK